MRTIKEWFEAVADKELREKLLANMGTSRPAGIGSKEVASLYEAVNKGFVWGDAREGRDYWVRINNAAAAEKIPLIFGPIDAPQVTIPATPRHIDVEIKGPITKISDAPQVKATPSESPRHVCDIAKDLIAGDRAKDYGDVTKNFANIADGWKVIFGVPVTPEQVGLAMAWLKIAREAQGGKKRDNLVDGIGYLALVDKIKGEK